MAASESERPGALIPEEGGAAGLRIGPVVEVPLGRVSDLAPRGIVELALREWEAASARVAPAEHIFRIAGLGVRLLVAGEALERTIVPALSHLRTAATSEPSLTVVAWDAAGTGGVDPAIPAACRLEAGVMKVHTHGDLDHPLWYQPAEEVLSGLARSLSTGFFWAADATRLPYYESGAPLLHVLHWWMADRGRQLMHGGAVGTQDGGALLVGRGGSGKSTAALSCLGSDLHYVSDDYVLVSSEPRPFVHSIYNTGKLDALHERAFPGLLPPSMNPDRADGDKALTFVAEHHPDALLEGCPIDAIVVPRVTGLEETTFRPLPRAQALSAVAPSTIFQLAGAAHGAFETMARLVQRLPAYRLETGRDLTKIPPAIAALLRDAKERSRA